MQNFHKTLFTAIRTMYKKTMTTVEVFGFFSSHKKFHHGGKQGRPPSTFLFILALEPLLQAVLRDPQT